MPLENKMPGYLVQVPDRRSVVPASSTVPAILCRQDFKFIFPHKRFLKLIGGGGNLSKRSSWMEACPRTTRGCAIPEVEATARCVFFFLRLHYKGKDGEGACTAPSAKRTRAGFIFIFDC
jgi:hypothetical protein